MSEVGVMIAQTWDRAGMLDRMLGDEDLAAEVLDVFLEDLPRQLEGLSASLEVGDRECSERLAHTIKGSSANVGGDGLRAVAFEIEKAVRSGNMTGAISQFSELSAQADRLRVVIERDRAARSFRRCGS